jgi:hypothetical protein
MAKIVYVCHRGTELPYDFLDAVQMISRRIIPDNIEPAAPIVHLEHGIYIGAINPTAPLLRKDAGICLGYPIFVPTDWYRPGGGEPDGTYSLFRGDENEIELGTDLAATRTIWYAKTDQLFVASNSQRAIVMLLGSFEFNQEAVPWMLAGGILGPGMSWDRRIQSLGPDSILKLNRKTWDLEVTARKYPLAPTSQKRSEQKAVLKQTLEAVFDEIDPERWIVTLSGGVDSRAILALLNKKKHDKISCVSWGYRETLNDPERDVCVARDLAKRFDVPWEFIELAPPADIPGKTILDRFVQASEGRNDNIFGYLDGMALWETFFEKGVYGIIRGDEIMGHWPRYSKYQLLSGKNIHPLDSYQNLPDLSRLGLVSQRMPAFMEQKRGEKLVEWGIRLEREYFITTNMAGLNELKTCYVEIMNPLISRKAFNVFRSIPTAWTRNKLLFIEIVNEMCPQMPYAFDVDDISTENLMKRPYFLEPILDRLGSDQSGKYVPRELCSFLTQHVNAHEVEIIKKPSVFQNIKAWLIRNTPRLVFLTAWIPRKIELNLKLMAFRAYIIAEIGRTLEEDAGAGMCSR